MKYSTKTQKQLRDFFHNLSALLEMLKGNNRMSDEERTLLIDAVTSGREVLIDAFLQGDKE